MLAMRCAGCSANRAPSSSAAEICRMLFSPEPRRESRSATRRLSFAKGFTAAGVKAGIKKSGNLDVAVIYTKTQAVVAGTFTQNKVAAAPVYVSKEVVATGTAHAIVANAGCANACTGQQGLDDAHKMA